MDKHLKRTQRGKIINLFSKSLVNDQAIAKMKKKKVLVSKNDLENFNKIRSQRSVNFSRTTAESKNLFYK
jgi:hypothetical protein